MRCKKPNGTYTTVKWIFFYAQCTRIQNSLGLCSASAGAYVPAIAVCNQQLFS